MIAMGLLFLCIPKKVQTSNVHGTDKADLKLADAFLYKVKYFSKKYPNIGTSARILLVKEGDDQWRSQGLPRWATRPPGGPE